MSEEGSNPITQGFHVKTTASFQIVRTKSGSVSQPKSTFRPGGKVVLARFNQRSSSTLEQKLPEPENEKKESEESEAETRKIQIETIEQYMKEDEEGKRRESLNAKKRISLVNTLQSIGLAKEKKEERTESESFIDDTPPAKKETMSVKEAKSEGTKDIDPGKVNNPPSPVVRKGPNECQQKIFHSHDIRGVPRSLSEDSLVKVEGDEVEDDSASFLKGSHPSSQNTTDIVPEGAISFSGQSQPPLPHPKPKNSATFAKPQPQPPRAVQRQQDKGSSQSQSRSIRWAPDNQLVVETRAKTQYNYSESAMKWKRRKEVLMACFKRDSQDEY